MILVLKFDLDMVKMYHHTKNEVSMSRHSKVIAQTDKHTDSMKTLPSRIFYQLTFKKFYQKLVLRVRLELTTSASLSSPVALISGQVTVYKYGALTDCATGAQITAGR